MEHRADSATPGGPATVHRTIPVSAPESPVAALADIEAWKARKTYPSMLFAGGPVFGAARACEAGRWELLPHFSGLAPQDARDGLGAYFRRSAEECRARGDARSAGEYAAAGELLDWEARDDLTVAGRRYRVVRAERFIRMGPDGPEPPRVTDPDPGDPGECEGIDPAAGLVVDPYDPTGVPDGLLKAELLAALRKHGTVPGEVRADSHAAALSHPGGVLLPATFMMAERDGDRWRPGSTGTAPTPQSARDALAMQLRVMLPWQRDLTDEQRAVYNRAADRLDADRCDELAVAGRHFRIVRVERLLRVGPEGPEGPRPSDPDPVPPLMVQDRELRDQDHCPEDDDPADEPDERTLRFLRLFDEERRRRQALRGS